MLGSLLRVNNAGRNCHKEVEKYSTQGVTGVLKVRALID